MCLIFMKLGTQNKSNMLIMNILIGIDDFDPKLKIREIWPQKCVSIFMKFDIQSKSNMQIMNTVLGIDYLD